VSGFLRSITIILCLCCGAHAADAQNTDANGLLHLLDTSGMSEDWLQESATIREHLGKLDADDPTVAQFTPAITRRCATLAKLKKIGAWERAIFVDIFAAMLEDLVNGDPVLARYAGQTVNYGYWSEHTDRLTGTKIQVPPKFDAGREYQMFMYYKLGGGLYWRSPTKKWAGPADEGAKISPPYRPTAEMCQNTPDTFHAWSALHYAVKGRMGLVEELKELTHAMSQDFSISKDRIFLSGYSDGGFSAMWLASHYPHLVAGIAPGVANWQYANTEHFSFFNFATLVVDGWRDGGYIQENLARFAALGNMGYDIEAIVSHHGHKAEWLENVDTVQRIMAWAKSKRRDLNRKHIKYATWNLAWNRAFWFSIRRMQNPLLAAVVDAQIDGNTIHVQSKNIAVYRIDLNEHLVDMGAPVKIYTNGELSYEGPYQEQITIDYLEMPEGLLVKTPESHGGIKVHASLAAYSNKKSHHKKFRLADEPWAWVTFTGGDDREVALPAINPPKWAKPDTEFLERESFPDNLMIYGGPLRNRFAAKIADHLPITSAGGRFSTANVVYDEPQQWVKFIVPNPLAPERDCLIFAFNDPVTAAKELNLGAMKLNPWGFREGDCMVFGVRKSESAIAAMNDKQKNKKGSQYRQDVYIFDSNWQVSDQAPLGEATETFHWADILQLKAEAIRERLGTDVGLYNSQPGFLKWKTRFDKGPITMNDVAMTHQFPEFIMTCELSGEQLKKLVLPDQRGKTTVAHHTLCADTEDPRYDPETSILLSDIDPDKTYTIAAGYALCDRGTLGLGQDTEQMPKPYCYFASIDDFVGHEAGYARSSNLMQSDVEVTEAVMAYIEKRGTVDPLGQ